MEQARQPRFVNRRVGIDVPTKHVAEIWGRPRSGRLSLLEIIDSRHEQCAPAIHGQRPGETECDGC